MPTTSRSENKLRRDWLGRPLPSNAADAAALRWGAWEAALRIATIYKRTAIPDEARVAIVAHALIQAKVDPTLDSILAANYAVAAVNATLREDSPEDL